MATVSEVPFSNTVWRVTKGLTRKRVYARKFTKLGGWLLNHLPLPGEEDYLEGLAGLTPPEFRTLWPKAVPHTMLDIFRLANLLRRLEEAIHLEGDIIECGVGDGGSALMMALFLRDRASDKRLVLCDSFAGLPRPDSKKDTFYTEGAFATPLDAVTSVMEANGVADRCEFHVGWFSDTLPKLAAGRRFAFAHIDGDLYASTKTCVEEVYPRLVPTAPMVFDDYYEGFTGVSSAVNEALAGDLNETLQLGPSNQAFLRKGERGATPISLEVEADGFSASGIPIAVDDLRGLGPYLEFLRDAESTLRSTAVRVLWHIMRPIKEPTLEEMADGLATFRTMCEASLPPGSRARLDRTATLVWEPSASG